MDTTERKPVKTITGARALVDTLLREGVDHVFGIPGTQNLAFLDALRDTPQMLITGTLPLNAAPMPVTMLVMPGPSVTVTTDGLLAARA